MRNLFERAAAITVLATALVASGAGDARASLVTYTETATVSGSLGSTTFTGATITMTQTADSANVTINPISHSASVLDTTLTLVIFGGDLASPLSASFTSPTYTLSSPTATLGGVGPRIGPGIAIVLGEINPAFVTYDLTTSFGPVSGPAGGGNYGNPFSTTAGALILNEAGTVTFQAVSSAVPEPSSLAMGSLAGAIGLAIAAGRRPRTGGR